MPGRVWAPDQNFLLKSVSMGFCAHSQLLFSFVLAFVVRVTSLTQFLEPGTNVSVTWAEVAAEVRSGGVSVCYEGLGHKAVKVGSSELTLGKGLPLLSTPGLACPPPPPAGLCPCPPLSP